MAELENRGREGRITREGGEGKKRKEGGNKRRREGGKEEKVGQTAAKQSLMCSTDYNQAHAPQSITYTHAHSLHDLLAPAKHCSSAPLGSMATLFSNQRLDALFCVCVKL